MTDKKTDMDLVRGLLEFIEKSPCSYQAVENAEAELQAAGYLRLEERKEWELKAGGKYYVNRNGSSLLAFYLPEKEIKGFHIIASHSDSPCFKVKESPETGAGEPYLRLNVEKYGGMIMSTWLDRPLSVAGRVVLNKRERETGPFSQRYESRNIRIDRDLVVIPNVAVHMNRDINKGVEYNAQTDMLPLYGGIDSKDSFLKLIAEEAGAEKEEIAGYDLFLYNREKGGCFGVQNEFLYAPRLDDLECVYTSLQAMLQAVPEEYINLLAVFDNEEVGSMTRQGAASTFLRDTLERVCEALSFSKSDCCRLTADSFLLSADNAHAVHPNHPEKADPTNRPCLNGGVVIKYHGGQKYTTDAVSAAVIKEICEKAKVPFQTYANRSDIPGGSTLGNISSAQVPFCAADIGIPQLAMHSACETAGSRDVEYMYKVMHYFYSYFR